MRWFTCLILAACGFGSVDSAEPPAKLELQAYGVLANMTVTVESKVEGFVKQFKYQRGDRVKAGELLVELDLSVQEAELKKARAALELAQARLKQYEAKPQPDMLDLAVFRAEVKYAEATVEVLETRWKNRAVTMPFDGVVMVAFVTVGNLCQPGTHLLTVSDPSRYWVEADVPTGSAANVRPDQPCLIGVDGIGKVAEGKVAEIGEATMDKNKKFVRVRVALTSVPKEWTPGMFATVRFLDK